MTSKINQYYIYVCEDLIDYIFKINKEEEAKLLLNRLIYIRSKLRFKNVDDYLLRDFWRCHDATYRL